ncbi:helix-turn-helix domain-containing protein [Rhodococcus qingshengii]|uniref:helix-turn-helix domain-containing protein n=1 Tax=Rhodococcus qingshengii TaxID=334542 RepID=UPI003AFAFB90
MRSQSVPPAIALRVRLILLAAEGHSNTSIARLLGVSRPTVISWRSRYRENGLAGLIDRPRSGRPRVVDPRIIISAMLSAPPQECGVTQWSSRLLAKKLQISKTTVQAAWREYGIRPCRSDSFCYSTVPKISGDVTEIVALYIGPRTSAIALFIAEEPTSSKLGSRAHASASNDQINRYLQQRDVIPRTGSHLTTETFFGQCRCPLQDNFSVFCERIVDKTPNSRVHVIFDSDSSDEFESVRSYLPAYLDVQIHHTSTPTAWIRLVDVWITLAEDKEVTDSALACHRHFQSLNRGPTATSLKNRLANPNRMSAPPDAGSV